MDEQLGRGRMPLRVERIGRRVVFALKLFAARRRERRKVDARGVRLRGFFAEHRRVIDSAVRVGERRNRQNEDLGAVPVTYCDEFFQRLRALA